LSEVRMSSNDRHKILRRTQYLVQRRAAWAGTSHLSSDDKRKLTVLRNGWDWSQSPTSRAGKYVSKTTRRNLYAKSRLPFSSGRFASQGLRGAHQRPKLPFGQRAANGWMELMLLKNSGLERRQGF